MKPRTVRDTLINKNAIYVTWTRNDLVKGGQDIVASYSTDLGKTWNGPTLVNSKNTSRLVILPKIDIRRSALAAPRPFGA